MKIIIVDDDCLVAGALKTILEVNEDVEVLATGADGKEACELYERYEPDVLLMDIRMEKMDGLEASRSILSRYCLLYTSPSPRDRTRSRMPSSA